LFGLEERVSQYLTSGAKSRELTRLKNWSLHLTGMIANALTTSVRCLSGHHSWLLKCSISALMQSGV